MICANKAKKLKQWHDCGDGMIKMYKKLGAEVCFGNITKANQRLKQATVQESRLNVSIPRDNFKQKWLSDYYYYYYTAF